MFSYSQNFYGKDSFVNLYLKFNNKEIKNRGSISDTLEQEGNKLKIKSVIPSWVFWFLLTLALAVYFAHKGYDVITALGIGFILAYFASIILGYVFHKLRNERF